MFRAFLKDSAIYAIPAFVSQGLSIFLVPLYTRILRPADYGALDMLLVFGGLVNLTVALEVSQGLARFYPDEPDSARKRAYASSALWFSVGCYGLFVLAALANSAVLSTWVTGQNGLEPVFRVGVIHIGLSGIFCLLQNQFRWELRSRRYAETSLLLTFVTAGSALWFTYGLGWGLAGLLWGMVLGGVAGTVYGGWWLRHSFALEFDRHRLWEMLRFSMPLVLSGIVVWANIYIDRMMINHYLSLNEVGLYGIGYRLSSVVGLLIAGIQMALMPLVYAHHREPDTPLQLERIFRFFLAGALLMFLGLSLFARDILVIMTTPNFYSSAALVIYLVPAAMLAQMYIFAPGIGIARKTHLFFWFNLAGVIVNGTLNWVLIPMLGISGAAIATLASSACVFALCMVISQRLYPVPHGWGRLVMATILALALAILIPGMAPAGAMHWFLNIVGIVVMACGLIMMGLIRQDELKRAFQELRARLAL